MRKIKAWAVVMPDDWQITKQITFPTGTDHDKKGASKKYVYYYEVFLTKKDALERRKWIENPKGCKVVPITLSYQPPPFLIT